MSTAPQGSPSTPSTVWRWVIPAVLLLLVLLLPRLVHPGGQPESLNYTQFVNAVDAGQVKQISITDAGAVSGVLTNGTDFTSQVPTALGSTGLTQLLQAHGVAITATTSGTSWVTVLFTWLPLLLIVALFIWMGRRAARGLSGISTFGRSQAKVIDAQRPSSRFADVAGYAGAKREIAEVLDYLRDPRRYAAVGARGPRGVLLVGPPGTGKTMLARAVAGEASVPFLSISGSSFVELFVGVGASRVRDLFADARRRAPAIVFIDEIDALGRRREGAAFGGNDEREQTLNQLLAEMDGFEQAAGVVVIAATNRPDALDTALLRPGRFDRQIMVSLPAQADREAILAVHARGKPLDPSVDLSVVARATPGFSGADLANLINEAAIRAIRAGRTVVTMDDLDAARDRILLGHREDSNVLLPEEKEAVAVHEAGHAVTAALSEHADPVAKVTILPAGVALGATEQLPETERHLYGEAYLRDTLMVRLGGRAAELLVRGEPSSGAADDLAAATTLATRMVRELGLSTRVGPVGYGGGHASLSMPGVELAQRPYSEETQRRIDTEVAQMLREAEHRASTLLREHRSALDRVAGLLLEHETIDGSAIRSAVEKAALTPVPRLSWRIDTDRLADRTDDAGRSRR